LNLALSTLVQPRLCGEHPTVVYGFPASQAALAKRNPDDPRVAQRFELFHGGVELANGYEELTNLEELQSRQRLAIEERVQSRASRLPMPARFFAAAAKGIPACTGVALGFDRLVMLATGQKSLAQVMPFPWPLA
jgi:lysyl-tRNA synthetase class 2